MKCVGHFRISVRLAHAFTQAAFLMSGDAKSNRGHRSINAAGGWACRPIAPSFAFDDGRRRTYRRIDAPRRQARAAPSPRLQKRRRDIAGSRCHATTDADRRHTALPV